MPNNSVKKYLQEKTGVDLERLSLESNSRNLCNAAQRLGEGLSNTLHKAVVRFDGNQVLTGTSLSANQLKSLKEIAVFTLRQPECPQHIQLTLKNFAGAAYRYEHFFSRGETRFNFATNIINKNVRFAIERGQTTSAPRHTLIRRGNEVYEILTWMTAEEKNRIKTRFRETDGLISLATEEEQTLYGKEVRTRTKSWGDEHFTEDKSTLGSGGFGSARLARRVSDDQYFVFKKMHFEPGKPNPVPTRLFPGVNDGSKPGVSKVYDSFYAFSTRKGGEVHLDPSVYTLTEIGVVDTHQFINMFSVMCFAFNPAYKDVAAVPHPFFNFPERSYFLTKR